MKRIFITGGFGYIGSKLGMEAIRRGHSVFLYDSLIYGQNATSILKELNKSKAPGAECKWVEGDTRDLELLRKSVVDFRPDFLFHFAELVGVFACNDNPPHTEEINFKTSRNVIDLAHELKVPVIYNSTSSLYGNQKDTSLLDENAPLPESTDNYCKNKLKMEEYINQKLMTNSAFKALILRPATIWGIAPRMRLELLPNHFTYCAISKGLIKISEPNSYRAIMDIDDLIESYFSIIQKGNWSKNTYNIGHHNMSKMQVAKAIQALIDCDIQIIGDLGDLRNLQIDSTAFYRDFEFSPKYSFEDTLKTVEEWIRLHLTEIEASKYAGMINTPLNQWLKII